MDIGKIAEDKTGVGKTRKLRGRGIIFRGITARI